MNVSNALMPNKEQIEGFFEEGAEGPIYMLNLLKFKEHASFEDGRETDLSGAQAYQQYMDAVTELLPRFGGEASFAADVERLMLGDVEELWDMVAIATYPSRQAMMDMMQSEAYQAIHPFRDAGLAGQLNIETKNAVFASSFSST